MFVFESFSFLSLSEQIITPIIVLLARSDRKLLKLQVPRPIWSYQQSPSGDFHKNCAPKKKSQFITLLLVELLSPFCSPAVSCCQPWQPSSTLHYFRGINWSDNNTGRRCILGDLGTVKICDYQMPDCWKHCLIRWSPNNSVGFNCCI